MSHDKKDAGKSNINAPRHINFVLFASSRSDSEFHDSCYLSYPSEPVG
jgi:hypothetical protein